MSKANPSGGIRNLVGKLFGREGSPHYDPFSETALDVIPTLESPIDDETFRRLEAALGYRIQSRHFFVQALTHRSYLQVIDDDTVDSNERLEFLGDSILNMLIGEFLFRHYTDVQEGELTKLRSRLVNKKALIVGARQIGLETFVLLNTSAERSLRQGNQAILADAFEAIIAAIYLDSGLKLKAVKHFLTRTLLRPDTFEEILGIDENYKSALLEMAQGRGLEAPYYAVVEEEGPDHERTFTIEVFVGGTSYGRGSGRSKKKAEQESARMAIEALTGSAGNGVDRNADDLT